MARGVCPVAHRDLLPGPGLGARISGHGHIGFGQHHTGDPVLIRPSQRGAIQTALITDDLLQAGHAGQIYPRLGDQGPGPEGLMLVNLPAAPSPNGPQELEEIIHHGAFVQAVDPIDLLLAIPVPGHARIIPARHVPTQPLGQVLGELIFDLSHRPPPFPDSLSAIEQSGRRIKPSAYVGISGKVKPPCQHTLCGVQ